VEELFDRISLYDETQKVGFPGFKNAGISEDFIREMVAPVTRVNYNQEIEDLSMFAGLTAMVGSGGHLHSTVVGNSAICEGLAVKSKAKILTGEKVEKIIKIVADPEGADQPTKKYIVKTSIGDEKYDVVVVAVPIELAGITFENIPLDSATTSTRKYQVVHVTLVAATSVNPIPFSATSVLDHIFTTRSSTFPFTSLSRNERTTSEDGRNVYKLFSRELLGDHFLQKLFLNGTVLVQKSFSAYPILIPMKPYPPIILAEDLYYVNAFESAVSTMETESIASKNIVRLIAKNLGYSLKDVVF